jgi:phytanoyl-CoA hydroxylase
MGEIEQSYQENGYYIFRQLIPNELIDELLADYQKSVLPSKKYFFRQSSNRWEKHKLTEHGYCVQSLLDIHNYQNSFPNFGEAAKKIFCLQAVRQALNQLTGSAEHSLMQSMFFDLNAATPAHQDWYYLDSMPSGNLAAGWFALEDIEADAGRFFVVPRSHKIEFQLSPDEKISNGLYLDRLNRYTKEHSTEVLAPALKKGDVLFWNSGTIHGSLPTINPKFSRKSLTAHYIPSQLGFGNVYAKEPFQVNYFEYDGMKCRQPPESQYNYTLKARLETELRLYLWYHPKLFRAGRYVYNTLKKISGKAGSPAQAE